MLTNENVAQSQYHRLEWFVCVSSPGFIRCGKKIESVHMGFVHSLMGELVTTIMFTKVTFTSSQQCGSVAVARYLC